MDPVAHTLVGASLAAAGFKRLSRLGAATLVVGANLPDMDAASYALGADASLLLRRGWTHGIAAMVVLPVLLAGSMTLLGRVYPGRDGRSVPAPRFAPLLLLALISVWSHPALDLLNTYGIRLLMPFDDRWFYGDTLFIIDPWFWLLAGVGGAVAARRGRAQTLAWIVLGLVASAFVLLTPIASWTARLVWFAGLSAIVVASTKPRVQRNASTVAVAGLGVLLVYVAAMRTGSIAAREDARAWLAARAVTPLTLMAGPLPGSPWRRDVIVGLADRYEFLVVDLRTGEIRPSGPPVVRGDGHPAVAAALATAGARGFRAWQRYPAYTVSDEPAGLRVLMRDVRYARKSERGFAVVDVHLDDRSREDRRPR